MKMITWIAAAGILAAALPVEAQYGQKKDDKPAGPPKVVDRTNPRDWTLSVTVNLRPETHYDSKTNMPDRKAFDFTSAAVVFPIVRDSASHTIRVAERELDGKLKLNDRVVHERPTEILSDYPAGTKLAKWAMQGWSGEEVELEIKIPVTSWRVTYDEALANKLKWPDPPSWGSAQSALEHEYYIDMGFDGPYDMAPVKDLVKKWTGGKDPKAIAPAQLAKFLAGEVMKHVQTSGNGLAYARTGQLEGIDLKGAPETAASGRGSEFDMVCLLVAAYRQCGLPARCVIGYDVGEDKGRDGKFLSKKGSTTLRSWAEFALIDPAQDDPVVWVPVDIVRLRKSSTRPPPLDRPWTYFGSNKEFDYVVPFAFQFFPPSKGVVSHGAPAFYGWMVTPAPPKDVVQALRFDAISTPKTAQDQKKEREEKEKRGR